MFPLGNKAYAYPLGYCLSDKIRVVTTAPSLRFTFPIAELLLRLKTRDELNK